MKDRYLFRGKRIDNGEWVVGKYVNTCYPGNDKETGHFIVVYPNEYHEIYTSTICQCTGLKDKNGKLIWENDIVNMRCNGLSGYGTVIYINGCYWIDDKKRGRQYPFSNHDVKYRVDGNVFDDPELLEDQV